MDQLTQILKTGEMKITEVPVPQVSPGMLLVRNHFSIISAGTEASTVKTARSSLLDKARSRPQDVKQVFESFKRIGPVATYRAVMKKLDSYSPLGYSSSGIVIDVGEGVSGFAIGDKVACAGAGYANHAEIVSVPQNLCVKLPGDADLLKASYNTIGSIALQGIRQADLRLGETCAVIGLGLIGQLTCLMLKASGVKAIGIDIDDSAVKLAKELGCYSSWLRNDPAIDAGILNLTNGIGVDAVIITAGTPSLDPVNFSGKIARKKGRVVIVGAVPTGFDRDPYYYRKELELKMSCSYGPGRYDLNYEEKALDYPVAYVRWTENRNMQAFQEMIYGGLINIDRLTSHIFSFDKATDAYSLIVGRTEPFIGIVLKYDTDKLVTPKNILLSAAKPVSAVGVAFIGAGSYAQGNLLPYFNKNDQHVVMRSIVTQSGTTAKRVAEKFGFENCAMDVAEVLNDSKVNTVFIATRHDSHAENAINALKYGKNVFVEKPLCLTLSELHEIFHIYNGSQHLMVGFNRRFAPLTETIKKSFTNGPFSMIYRINAGAIPAGSWIQDLTIGGGRILGEVCHFIDYLSYICDEKVMSVHANALSAPHNLNDTVTINIKFNNGSVGTVCYFSNGSKEMSKERLEIFCNERVAVLDDFKELDIYAKNRPIKSRLLNQDKGQKAMVTAFLSAIKEGRSTPISPDSIFNSMSATFAVVESLKTGGVVELNI